MISLEARHVEKPFVSSTSEACAGRAPSAKNRRNAGNSDDGRNNIVSCLCRTERKEKERGGGESRSRRFTGFLLSGASIVIDGIERVVG